MMYHQLKLRWSIVSNHTRTLPVLKKYAVNTISNNVNATSRVAFKSTHVQTSFQQPPFFRSSLQSNQKHHNSQANSTVGRVILVRHGQSIWNVTDPDLGLTARFTGWADIALTNRGKDQAKAAGRALLQNFKDGKGEQILIE